MPKLKVRKGIEADLPSLEVAEPGFTTDTKKFFIGSDLGNVEMAKKESLDSTNAEVTNARGTHPVLMDRLDEVDSSLVQSAKKIAGVSSKNLFNKNTAVKGYYVDHITGNLLVNSSFFTTDFIKVNPSDTYVMNDTNRVAFYDKDKKFISGIIGQQSFTISTNCVYLRTCTVTSVIDSFQVEAGTTSTSYAPYSINVLDSNSLNVSLSHAITNLRIAYHFNYENDETKFRQVRDLGFNTVWVAKQADFMLDSVRTLAFLDRLLKYGIQAILQVSETEIVKPDPSVEQAWITAVEVHPAVIGFATYDEPVGRLISITNQNLAYTNIKAKTTKNVFMVETETEPSKLFLYYTPSAYDVYLLDIYATRTIDVTEDDVKKEIVKRIMNIKNYPDRTQPKQIIPVFPLFSDANFALPTEQRLKWHLDAWRPFYNGSYMVFAHDVAHQPSALTATLDTSEALRKLATIIPSYLSSVGLKYETSILPRGFNLHSKLITNSNAVYNSVNSCKIGSTGTIMSVTYRVERNPYSYKLIMHSALKQKYDGNTSRIIKHEFSYDGSTWTSLLNTTFVNTEGISHVSSTTVSPDTAAVYCRVTIDNTALGNVPDPGYVGLLSVGGVMV